MDLRRIVKGPIGAVNPQVWVSWLKYLTASTDSSGISTPTYADALPLYAQVQPLATDQLAHMDQLNIQGVLRSVYLRGAVATAVRENGTGGDLLQFPETKGGPQRTWLVVQVPEQWPDWCNVVCKLQNDQNSIGAPLS
jgi:hypothetical protein